MAEYSGWFEYDWKFEGDSAVYGVDLDLFDAAREEELPFLFDFSCARPDGEPLSRGDTARAERLQRKCAAFLPCYAGCISTDFRLWFFFYGPGPEAMGAVEALEMKERKLACYTGCRREADWRTYFRLLYPDAAKFQTELNREALAVYEKGGDVMNTPRRITLHLFFPAEPLLNQFTEAARLAGFAVGKSQFAPEYGLPHGISLYRIAPLDKRRIDALTTRAIRLAERFEGKLVHWNCQLIPKKRPLT